ncbi:hypothetical protein [Adlercreutzia aquisgranensis]|uniref:hypothetical protein n=1 Tax=Adlercreutzia aquisgranensis TaxID=2941323 RepID=UPI00203E9C0E|nr:hypothetical protein [Adlercreutzia aquisgranensis]
MGFIRVLALESRRAFSSGRFLATMIIGVIFVVCHIVLFVVPEATEQAMYILQWGYPLSVYNRWLGGWFGTVFPTIFFFFLPLLVCVPYSDTLYLDKKTGWANQVTIRSSRAAYYGAKVLIVFSMGVIVACVPLVLDFYLTCMFLPLVQPSVASGLFPIFNESLWHDLYYADPLVYNLRYMALIATTCGLLACLPLALSKMLSNRPLLVCSSFFICVILNYLFGRNYTAGFSPMSFMRPDQPFMYTSFSDICVTLLLLALAVGMGIAWVWRSDDVGI